MLVFNNNEWPNITVVGKCEQFRTALHIIQMVIIVVFGSFQKGFHCTAAR